MDTPAISHGLTWLGALVAGGCLLAAAFLASSYLVALAVTRGAFGWPGFGYFFRETLWCVVTQSALPWGFIRRAPPPLPRDDTLATAARPVVLVHGFTQNRTNFLWLSRYLSGKGHGPLYSFDYQSFQRIETSARQLEAFVEQVLRATSAERVDLVCHSLGGLVARTYVDLLGGHARVARVVTLGTPHQGIRIPAALLGPSVRDMLPRYGFIARLAAAELPDGVRYHSIYSVHDNIVVPGKAVSSLGGRGEDIVVQRHGHFGILFSAQVAEHVHLALSAEG